MTRACLDLETVAVLMDGTLTSSARRAVDDHVLECAKCRRLVAQVARLDEGEPPTPAAMNEQTHSSREIGRYSVLELIGRGGMGHVYAAYDPQLDRKIAIKTIRGPAAPNDEQARRLIREAQALARVRHENVVAVHDSGLHDGDLYIAMEFVDGCDLATHLRENSLHWREIVALFVRAGRGLAATHEAGLLHRDFKSRNVLVSRRKEILLADFGLAATGDDPVESAESTESASIIDAADSRPDFAASLTESGVLVGTVSHMAPERLAGRAATTASDQFSFCVALYEALFGALPFAGRVAREVTSNIRRGVVRTDVDTSNVPGWLRKAVLRGLARRPRHRHPSMHALVVLLERGLGRRKRRAKWLGIGVAAGTAMAFLASDRDAPVCADASERVEVVWNDETRTALQSVFEASRLPGADAGFAATVENLDAFGRRWTTEYADACEATHVRRTQPVAVLEARMTCLDGALNSASATLDTLRSADVTLVSKAAALTHDLVDAAACTQERSKTADPPPPPEIREAVHEAGALLDRAGVAMQAGQIERSYALASRGLEQARRIEWSPLVIRAYAQMAATRIGDTRTQLEEVVVRSQHEAPWAARYRVSALTELALQIDDDGSGGHELLLEMAESAARESGDDTALAIALYGKGVVASEARDAERALGHLRRARDLLLARDVPEYDSLKNVWIAIAHTEFARGNVDVAIAEAERACRHLPPAWLYAHAYCDHHRAIYLHGAGRAREGIALAERNLVFYEHLQGSGDSYRSFFAGTLHNLGMMHHGLGELEAARDYYLKALEHKRRSPHKQPSTLAGLAELYNDQGRPDLALSFARRAKAAADEPWFLASAELELGRTHAALGHPKRARERLASSLAAFETVADFESSRGEGLARHHLARLIVAEDPVRARALARAALDHLSRCRTRLCERDRNHVRAWLAEHDAAAVTRG